MSTPGLSVFASVTFVAIGIATAVAAMTPPTLIIVQQGPTSPTGSPIVDDSPVFYLDQTAALCGRLKASMSQTSLMAYREGACPTKLSTAPHRVNFPASPHLLWALLPPDDQAEMIASVASFSPQSLVDHPSFRPYREQLAPLVSEAFHRARHDPETSAKLAPLGQRVGARHISALVEALWPVLQNHTDAPIVVGIRGLARTLAPRSGRTDARYWSRVLENTLADPDSAPAIASATQGLLHDDALGETAVILFEATAAALARDPEFQRVAKAMLADPNLIDAWAAWLLSSTEALRGLPDRLMNYQHPKDHNPLVAYVARAVYQRRETPVIIAFSDDLPQATALFQVAGSHPLEITP